MTDIYIEEVIIKGYAGSDIDKILLSAFSWMRDHKEVKKAYVNHLNGYNVIIERNG